MKTVTTAGIATGIVSPDASPASGLKPPGSAPVRLLFGIPIHAMTMQQTTVACDHAIQSGKRLMIGVVNVAKIVNMRRQPILGDAVLQSDIVLADGMAIVWASHALRQPLPERVAGIDLFEELLKLANQKRYSIYLLGATQRVMDRLVERITREYPDLKIAGSRNGYFEEAEGEKIAMQIADAHPDMLFLGMTSPKKEVFLARYEELMDVPVCHGVGGSFDVLAGQVNADSLAAAGPRVALSGLPGTAPHVETLPRHQHDLPRHFFPRVVPSLPATVRKEFTVACGKCTINMSLTLENPTKAAAPAARRPFDGHYLLRWL